MNIDEAKIKQLLDTITVQPVAQPRPVTTPSLAYELKTYATILQTLTLATLLLLTLSGRLAQPVTTHTPPVVQSVPARSPISITQAAEMKKLVKQVALCEQKHPNAVHKELRNRFGYKSYKTMNTSLYPQVQAVLQNRLCAL